MLVFDIMLEAVGWVCLSRGAKIFYVTLEHLWFCLCSFHPSFRQFESQKKTRPLHVPMRMCITIIISDCTHAVQCETSETYLHIFSSDPHNRK